MKAVMFDETGLGNSLVQEFTRVKGNRDLGGHAANPGADERLDALWDYVQAVWNNMLNPGSGGGNGGSTASTKGEIEIIGLPVIENGKVISPGDRFMWAPGKVYTGSNQHIIETVESLEELYKCKDELNITDEDDNHNSVSGNVLTDFLKGGKFESVGLTIWAGMPHTKALTKNGWGHNTIWYNPREGLKILSYENQKEGYQAPFFGLLHELGHIWINDVSPKRMQWFHDHNVINNLGNPFEEQIILFKVQNDRVCGLYGQGYQVYYNYSDLYETTGPLTTSEK